MVLAAMLALLAIPAWADTPPGDSDTARVQANFGNTECLHWGIEQLSVSTRKSLAALESGAGYMKILYLAAGWRAGLQGRNREAGIRQPTITVCLSRNSPK